MPPLAFIAFCSPAGSTRHVAGVIERSLSASNLSAHTLDLGSAQDLTLFLKVLESAGPRACLFIGSPVYRDMAVPPVMTFIESLPDLTGAAAVPFVTWGGACSGVALWQMGTALAAKGCHIAGAAKVLGTHSMMWRSKHPVGSGHPDADDDEMVKRLVFRVLKQLDSGDDGIKASDLDYQAEPHGAAMKKKLAQPWVVVPKAIDEARCSECGVCESECPAGAIILNPYPLFDDACFDCFNCIRLCPEDAIDPAVSLEAIEQHIRKRVSLFNETPRTELFLSQITPE